MHQPSDFLPAVNSVKEEQADVHITKPRPLPEQPDAFHITATTVTIDSVSLNLEIKHELTVKKEEEDERYIKSEEPIGAAFLSTTSPAAYNVILKKTEDPVDGEKEVLVLRECEFKRKERPVCRTLKYSTGKRQPVPVPVPEGRDEPDEFVREVPQKKKKKRRKTRKRQSSPEGTVCTLCGKNFAFGGNLKIHMRIHTGHRPFKCQHCGADFTRSDRLAEHISTHTGAEPNDDGQSGHAKRKRMERRPVRDTPRPTPRQRHLCDECGKSFRSQSCLHAHLLGHSQLRSHKCDLCDARFIHLSDLRRHLRGHTARPYPCKLCGREFRRADTLRKHTRIHTGERPFKCVPCGKTYRQHEGLRLHMKICHKG